MPKYSPAPWTRYEPKPQWLSIHFHPPKRGAWYETRRGDVEFKAYLNYDGKWCLGNDTFRVPIDPPLYPTEFKLYPGQDL